MKVFPDGGSIERKFGDWVIRKLNTRLFLISQSPNTQSPNPSIAGQSVDKEINEGFLAAGPSGEFLELV
jgi:hypothetical protein